MSNLYVISGFLELSAGQADVLRDLLESNVDRNIRASSWVLRLVADGGFAFFGDVLKEGQVESFRRHVEGIAASVHAQDPDVPWLDHVRGRFVVICDDDESEFHWVVGQGALEIFAPNYSLKRTNQSLRD